ncbi:MAG: ABC transporter ATP-binding protein [Clostridiales bacterium]|nr:ABC transporter ATP-binding protein [Clostridiales bacterium]
MILVQGITSAYGRKPVLKGVSFTAERGECVGIVGANGCGKSTLLSILAGTLKPLSGQVRYDGQTAWSGQSPRRAGKETPEGEARSSCVRAAEKKCGGRMYCGKEVIRKMTGYVPQENPLIPELTVYDNLRLWYPDSKTLKQELEQGALHLLGIQEYASCRADKLSGGMKKRVSMGIALSGQPPILLLDEPSAALDLICKEDIRSYLKDYLQREGTVVITTHEESELELCDKLYVMKDGKLRQIDRALRGAGLVQML